MTAAQIDKPTFAGPVVAESLDGKARRLLRSASAASIRLEADVRELVTMRAWKLLGHQNFAQMWAVEVGYRWPAYVRVIAVEAMVAEGMNRANSTQPANGHTLRFVGSALGMSHNRVSTIATQLKHGVPPDHVATAGDPHAIDRRIAEFGTRRRAHPRRTGKTPDEQVSESFLIRRYDADAVSDIARDANVPKSEIYRQAVAEYLARYRESRPKSKDQ